MLLKDENEARMASGPSLQIYNITSSVFNCIYIYICIKKAKLIFVLEILVYWETSNWKVHKDDFILTVFLMNLTVYARERAEFFIFFFKKTDFLKTNWN